MLNEFVMTKAWKASVSTTQLLLFNTKAMNKYITIQKLLKNEQNIKALIN